MPARGIYTVTVPGVVARWEAMRTKFGTLPMRDLLAPAEFYAEQGFPVTEVIAGEWAGSVKLLAAEPNAAKTYEGKTANAILAISREKGGTMTAADLKEFSPAWVEPISTTYRGWTVYELPPNTQGIAALMMLNLMERFPLQEYGFHSPKALHTMIEAKKLAYADVLSYVGDPNFAKVPVPAMLNKTNAARRAGLIDPAKASRTVEPSQFSGLTASLGADTIYLSVIDKDGNIVSLIQSLYGSFGSGLVPPDTGFMLHNRGGLFTLDENHPNFRKRSRPAGSPKDRSRAAT